MLEVCILNERSFEEISDLQVEVIALKLGRFVQEITCRWSFRWGLLCHLEYNFTFLVILFSEAFRELSSFLQIVHCRIPLHVSSEVATHFKENQTCCIDVYFILLKLVDI